MSVSLTIISAAFLVPLAFIISYYDICYRRIPNPFVLATLLVGFFVNVAYAGASGALASLGGCALGFFLMFVLHIFGAMGAGDVKLFAAIGAMAGANLVIPMFIVVTITGGVLGVISMLRAGQVKSTMTRVYYIVLGLLPGQRVPRFAIPTDRKLTIPYGVAITFGSLISLFLFRAW
ncbi:MAG TPA: prepilin peptidase [Pyrinomonadaceae bacterium]|nr:prepilin peptidase [Pyrinomonadaceae bacterium]